MSRILRKTGKEKELLERKKVEKKKAK